MHLLLRLSPRPVNWTGQKFGQRREILFVAREATEIMINLTASALEVGPWREGERGQCVTVCVCEIEGECYVR